MSKEDILHCYNIDTYNSDYSNDSCMAICCCPKDRYCSIWIDNQRHWILKEDLEDATKFIKSLQSNGKEQTKT